MFCSKCGTTIPDNAEFCFKCGTPVPTEAKTEVEPAPQQVAVQPQVALVVNTPVVEKKKSTTPLIIGIVAGAIVLVGLIVALCFVFLNNDNSSNSSNNSKTTEDTKKDENTKKEETKASNELVGTWYLIGEIDCYGASEDDQYQEEILYYDEVVSEWIFNEDGTLSFDDFQYSFTGTYKLNDDILTINANGDTLEAKIVWEDDKLLLVEYYDGEIGDDVVIFQKATKYTNKTLHKKKVG